MLLFLSSLLRLPNYTTTSHVTEASNRDSKVVTEPKSMTLLTIAWLLLPHLAMQFQKEDIPTKKYIAFYSSKRFPAAPGASVPLLKSRRGHGFRQPPHARNTLPLWPLSCRLRAIQGSLCPAPARLRHRFRLPLLPLPKPPVKGKITSIMKGRRVVLGPGLCTTGGRGEDRPIPRAPCAPAPQGKRAFAGMPRLNPARLDARPRYPRNPRCTTL